MTSILRNNVQLLNNNVEEQEFSNDITFSKNMLLTLTLNSDQAVNFVSKFLSKNNFEGDSTLKVLIVSVKDFQ